MIQQLILPLVAVSGVMLGCYSIARVQGKADIVDFGWTISVALAFVLLAIIGEGWLERRLLVAAMVSLWAIRLAGHLFFDRVIKPEEDGRYVELRAGWGDRAERNFLIFFLCQGLLAVLLAAPFLVIMNNSAAEWSLIELVGIGVWIVGIIGELLADAQLKRFKSEVNNKGRVCDQGLWRYSRHPNYFFEWLTWVGYGLIASAASFGAIGLFSPALILALILFVTGIPPTEQRAILSRGDEYRRYQQRTSAFFPWFPRRVS